MIPLAGARTRIKICGVRDVEIARAAVAAGADSIGVVLAAGSPRTSDVDTLELLEQDLPPFITLVAVLRNQPLELARSLPAAVLVQAHGDEDEAWLTAIERPALRGFAFDAGAVARWDRARGVVGLLVDGPAPGSGTAFDHARLRQLMDTIDTPVALAGGLTPETVEDAVRTVRPFAVDVSSGVESAPGVKDVDRICAFCAAVRRADAG